MKQCIVTDDLIRKVAGKKKESQSGEVFLSVTATLECGLRVTIRDTDPEFHKFGKYLKPGDTLSFDYTNPGNADERPWNFESGEGDQARKYEGVDVVVWKDMTAKAGNWTEEADTEFAGRSEAQFVARESTTAGPKPATAAAPPVEAPKVAVGFQD